MNIIELLHNYNKTYFKFFLRSLFRGSTPFFGLIFQITNRCNSKCITCFNWKILNKDIGAELTIEEIDKFTRNLGKLHTVTIGGGEPFLREDLSEIINCFQKNNNLSVVSIPTNCLSVDKILSQTKRILDSFKGTVKIGLSLDGIGQEHDKIRGIEGNFEKFLETYRGLSELKKNYAKLRLRLCVTVFDLNVDRIIDLIEYAEKNLPMVNSYGLELLKGDYNQEKIREAGIEKISRVFKKIEERNKNNKDFNGKIIKPIYRKVLLDILIKKEQIIPCRISAFLPVVDAQGNVYPCENREKIGNLRDFDYNLIRVWQSRKAKK